MKEIYSELAGAWEERGVIGDRVEIDGKRITVLWRNMPVLETKYKAEKSDGGYVLALKDTGLRYRGDASNYAELTRVFYKDGSLELTKFFPITGESKDVLTKTEYSRYGNFTIVDEILPELEGTWEDDNGFLSLVFRGDTMALNGEVTKIHVLRPGSGYGCVIADADPSKYDFPGFSRPEYLGGVITIRMIVCDAPPMEFTLKKK